MHKQDTDFSVFPCNMSVFWRVIVPMIAVVLGPLALFGCDRDEIRVYRAPKAPIATTAASQSQAPTVVWTLPEGWTEAPSEQSQRQATFRAGPEGIEVSLTAFPGKAGGALANINRWRGQLGLDPVDEAGLAEIMQSSSVDGVNVAIVDLQSPDGQRMHGAIVTPGDGQSWFVKATGEQAPLETIVESFALLARSIRMDAGSAAPHTDPHAGHNHPPGEHGVQSSAGSLETIEQRLAAWAPPSNWSPETDASPYLSAAFVASNGAGGARITVTRLGGDGGGSLTNINRWREQLGLPPAERLDAEAGLILDSPLVVDLESADASDRMVAAIIEAEDSMYYFNLTGTSAGAGAEVESFVRLVSQVGIGEGGR